MASQVTDGDSELRHPRWALTTLAVKSFLRNVGVGFALVLSTLHVHDLQPDVLEVASVD